MRSRLGRGSLAEPRSSPSTSAPLPHVYATPIPSCLRKSRKEEYRTRLSLRWRLGCQDEVWGEAGWLADAEAALAAGDSAAVEQLRTRAVSLLQLTPTGGRYVPSFARTQMMMRTLEARA